MKKSYLTPTVKTIVMSLEHEMLAGSNKLDNDVDKDAGAKNVDILWDDEWGEKH